MTEKLPLKYLSEAVLEQLRKKVVDNRIRYSSGDFADFEKNNEWSINTKEVTLDEKALANLDGTSRSAESDKQSSILLYNAMHGMTPALAREERIWVRLCHVECFNYARTRWLKGKDGSELDNQVHRHLFGNSLTRIRDDNALSRLWWNMHIASIADPDDPEGALELILKTADIRSNFVERTNIAARPPLARGIIRLMRYNQWISSTERAFREFMIMLNRNGGGILFEEMSEKEIDKMMESCASQAEEHLNNKIGEKPGFNNKKTKSSFDILGIFRNRI